MMKKFNISFKKCKPETGLASIGYPFPNTNIKVNKKQVGYITAPTWQTKDDKWGIHLAIIKKSTKASPCPWKWVSIKRRFDTEPEARIWIKENLERIAEKYKLHFFEEELQ